jgi:hypothetical protein
MVDGSMSSSKVTVGAAVVPTSVEPFAGVVDVTVGGVVSAAVTVAKDHTTLAAKAFPATSLTVLPVAPPRTVAV